MPEGRHHKLPGVQALRGVAAVMVLIGHALAEAEYYLGLALLGDQVPWTRGVDIFFVISGFVVTLSILRAPKSPMLFFRTRLARVVPLYFIFTTLIVVSLLVMPSGVKDTSYDPFHILSSFGFFPYARPDGRIAPVLSVGWTLNYEVYFYAIFALCLNLKRALLSTACILLSLVCAGFLFPLTSAPFLFWTDTIVIEFVFGMALAWLWYRCGKTNNSSGAILCLLVGVTTLIVFNNLALPRYLAAGVPATLIVAGGVLWGANIPKIATALGDASFALYLSHRFVLRAATLLLLPILPQNLWGAATYVVIVIIGALAAGQMTHVWLERPLARASTSLMPRRTI